MIEMLSNSAWALETRFFNRVSPLVLNCLSYGRDIPQSLIKNQKIEAFDGLINVLPGINMEFDRNIGTTIYLLEDGSRVASIPAKGALTKNGDACSYGSAELTSMIHKADNDPAITAMFGDFDGPGGSVSGIHSFSNAIYNSPKCTVGYVEQTAASAHYWSISQFDQVVANINEYSEVGSIGVLAMMVNETELLKKEGVKVEIMRAEQSKDKARLNSVEEWPEEELQAYQTQLNQIADDFISTVKRGRGNRLQAGEEDIFTGKMYKRDDAGAYGMIDKEGDKAAAIQLAADLAKLKSI